MIRKFLKNTIIREKYNKWIKNFLNWNLILVLLGQRRVWKTFIIFQFIKNLLDKKIFFENEIFYVNKEWLKFDEIKNYDDLKKYFFDWKEKNKVWEKFLIAIDEIQEIQDWEKFILWIWAEFPKSKIIISGSNSKLLSKDISTKLRWRYIEKTIYPLDFKEFCQFHNLDFSIESFNLFLQIWWLPELKNILTIDSQIEYLKNLYNTIFVKDIQEYFAVKNINLLQQIHKFLFSEVWNEISIWNIYKYLKNLNYKVWMETIWNYLNYSLNAFLFLKCERYDLKWKKILEWNNKYYVNDIWIKNAIVWYKDIWRILENLVYLYLVSNGYDVKIWKLYWKEIDFIAVKNGEKKYIQVSYLITNEEVKQREFWNLLKIKDNYEKIVVSMDLVKIWDYKWVKHLGILDFFENY